MKKVVATIEARTGSTRLPEKVLKPFTGLPDISMLGHIIERAKRSESIDQVVVATTDLDRDKAICAVAEKHGVEWFRGSENDILSRLSGAICQFSADILVSLTGDNPFIDPIFLDDMVAFWATGYDYVGSTHMQHCRVWDAERTFPRGVTAQVVSAGTVLEHNESEKDPAVRKKGLYCIYGDEQSRYRLGAFEATGKYEHWRHPELRMTVDTVEDFRLASAVYGALYPDNPSFSTGEAIALITSSEELRTMNSMVRQKIGYEELEAGQ